LRFKDKRWPSDQARFGGPFSLQASGGHAVTKRQRGHAIIGALTD
jgi:hypothetical protein